jgi:hypothetical protein
VVFQQLMMVNFIVIEKENMVWTYKLSVMRKGI